MAAVTKEATDKTDWQTLYGSSDDGRAIEADFDFQRGRPSVLRRLVVDLAEVAAKVAGREHPEAGLEIHTDVLRIEGRVALTLAEVRLRARRIEVEAGAALVVHPTAEDGGARACRLHFDAHEFAAATPDGALEVRIAGFRQCLDGRDFPGALDLSWDGGGELETEPAARVAPGDHTQLTLELLAAKRLDDRRLARKLALWVAESTPPDDADQRLFLEATTLAAAWREGDSGIIYVPRLRGELYEQLAQTFTEAVKAAESSFDMVENREENNKARLDAADAMLGHYRNALAFSQAVSEQAKENFEKAKAARDTAAKAFEEQYKAFDEAGDAYKDGLEEFRKDQERKAFWSWMSFGIGCVIALGGAFTGNPAIVFAGVSTASGSISGGADTPQKAKANKYLVALWVIAVVAQKVSEGIEKGLADGGGEPKNPEELREWIESQTQDGDQPDRMSPADWDEFIENMDAQLKPAIDDWGVPGALEYRKETRIMAIRGRAYYESAEACEMRAIEYRQAELGQGRDEKDLEQARQLVDKLKANEGPIEDLLLELRRLIAGLKGRLLLAIEDTRAAYAYQTLKRFDGTASLNQRAFVLQGELGKLKEAYFTALGQQRPQPLRFKPYVIREADFVDRFKATRRLEWMLPMSGNTGYMQDRVRVNTIRVWLDGARHSDGDPIVIGISTTGLYEDRSGDRDFAFWSPPEPWVFSYTLFPQGMKVDESPLEQDVAILTDGELGWGDGKNRFQPTPFATWRISLPDEIGRGDHLNQSIDLSGLTAIWLQFEGNSTAAIPMMRAAAAPPEARIRPRPSWIPELEVAT